MSEVFEVFYSWQSDTPRRHGRDLVREALDSAADAISRDSSSPYKILVQSDTENEAGLCNIPETILRRLRESDAIVSDLTFVAATTADPPKHCSNPNVLFELGYAFAQVGPQRLICVMNEAHGEAAHQIFDLAHHRRPIGYRSPVEDRKRAETIQNLATVLEAALRDVMKLGRRGAVGGDDLAQHQRQLSEINGIRESSRQRKVNRPFLTVTFRPERFRAKWWQDIESIEQALREHGPRTDRFHTYPPQVKGNAPMDWGLYNDIYGDPWAMTYAGQFWTEIDISSYRPYRLSDRDLKVSPEPPRENPLPETYVVIAERALGQFASVLQLAVGVSKKLAAPEGMVVEVEAAEIRDRWLDIHDHWIAGPGKAPAFRRSVRTTAGELQKQWTEYFADIGKDFCDLFCRDGRLLSRDDVKSLLHLS
ncbi:MAG: hypothetical protein U0939_12525 [Pirellulales bacterium]